jgi:hypothetical protein
MELYASQTQLLECLRDIWPSQKGLASLLFQNDLFWRLRRIEIKVEGGDPEDAVGFLPDDYPKWTSTAEYESIWSKIESEAALDVTEPLDVLEDAVCGWAEDMIPDSCAFFDAALDTGCLDEKWLHAAEMLRGLEEAPKEAPKEAVTIEPIMQTPVTETVISGIQQTIRSDTRRLRRVGRPLTPSFRRKIRSTRRNKSSK